ncbi:hypothetical protein VL15_09010 [Burkholderia cepacia]|uniref:Uncharacterized protein n=1 Tax=Burkholderia cepacia TaxID=292 RepID=A0A0J5X7L4_BURCE|nr:hypothetical protein [Burkholderia cepacia]KML60516.1 hypothetical protein VL15_09010 [Burkholderia cepacia]
MPLPIDRAPPVGHAPDNVGTGTPGAARQPPLPTGRSMPPALANLTARASGSTPSSSTVNPMEVMPRTRDFEVLAAPDGQPPMRHVSSYSSALVRPVQILRENRQGSILAATRQVFAVEVQSAPGWVTDREALVIREYGYAPHMALLDESADHRYEPRHNEPVRPLTPTIDRAFVAVSNTRVPLSDTDRERYRWFDAMRSMIPDDHRTHYIRATANVRFDNVDNVEDGELKVIVVPPGGDRKLGTQGVANCIACAASAPSRSARGSTVLALTHYTGAANGRIVTPRACLTELQDRVIAAGGDPSMLAIRLAGGERSASVNEGAHQLDEEFEFLALRGEFPIVAAHIQASSVDTNSDNQTIWRGTRDGHGHVISAVLATDGFFYAHAPLY